MLNEEQRVEVCDATKVEWTLYCSLQNNLNSTFKI